MLGYTEKIKQFIEENFAPGNPEVSEHWFTTPQILAILFTGFPDGCIDDYELNEILEPKFNKKLRIKDYDVVENGKIITKQAPPAIYWIIKIEEK